MKSGKIDLRFYFITDDSAPQGRSALEQARTAAAAGATAIQYRNKKFAPGDLEEACAIRDLCRVNGIAFLVNDDIVLASAARADGVHLGQQDADGRVARRILGDEAVIGISVSNLDELEATDLSCCDYIGTGPVFSTGTKRDAKQAIGLGGLAGVTEAVMLPVVAIGGITPQRAGQCFSAGAAGAAVISAITRADDPVRAAGEFAAACGVKPRSLCGSWKDEFGLIRRILDGPLAGQRAGFIRVGPGDDAALLYALKNPVITTDTQKEGVHFIRRWQSMYDIGYRASEITLSDLAASYAGPSVVFSNLALPPDISEESVLEICRGIRDSLEARGAVLAGGNISSSGELGIDMFAAAEGNPEIFPLRSAARPGWGVYVTGCLGLARAGLDCLMRGDKDFAGLTSSFLRPAARFDAAGVLAGNRVECVMDISDGLAGDAAHIAEASGVEIKLDLSAAPVHPELAAYCEKYGKPPLYMMAAGGDDYELLFACPQDVYEEVRTHLPGTFRVGTCLKSTGPAVSGLPAGAEGYSHGRKI